MAEFIYYNQNPDYAIKNDCVCRAISYATNRTYREIQEKLYHTGKLLDCDELCVDCYRILLEFVFGCEPVYCYGETAEEFADNHSKGTYLIRMNGHISVVENGNIIDIWDCRSKKLTNAWKVI